MSNYGTFRLVFNYRILKCLLIFQKTMAVSPKFILTALLAVTLSISVFTIQMASALSDGLTINVHLLAKKFGIGNVGIQIKGPFGYNTYRTVNLQNLIDSHYYNRLGDVYLTIQAPPGAIPDGYHYTVCMQDSIISLVLPKCQYTINHLGSHIENIYFNVYG